ncbi:hypothetical protein MHB50_06145 [Siminovitchia sp. FSL H7-0308]|uniref:hypothetical protein n=1 Tax=Siminovitchia sp. FSL H7-0308 TaxID=2921432 RepID=UPI0030ECEC1A
MKVWIGVVGPTDSVHLIGNVAKNMSNINVKLFPYKNRVEVHDIIQKNEGMISQWLFSGRVPYYFALENNLLNEDQAIYPPIYGPSLLGTLLKAVSEKNAKKYSLDTIQPQEITYIHYKYDLDNLTLLPIKYDKYYPSEEIMAEHLELYRKGEIEAALTCLQDVYEMLKAEEVPCYRVTPSELIIEQVLHFLKERAQSAIYKKALFAVMSIKIIEAETSSLTDQASFDDKRKELALENILLDFTQSVQGSYVKIGDGLFFVYTTKGQLELFQKNHPLQSLLPQIKAQSQLDVHIGIGYGLTNLQADTNTRLALKHLKEKTTSSIATVNENKDVVIWNKDDTPLPFSHRHVAKNKETKISLSSTTLSKLASLSKIHQTNLVTAKDISEWLGYSERNARRVLSELQKAKLASVKGEEQPGNRGRPRKIFELKL